MKDNFKNSSNDPKIDVGDIGTYSIKSSRKQSEVSMFESSENKSLT